MTIDAASVNTNNERRDNHLKTEDFFSVEKNPKITFVSKAIAVGKDGKGTMTGDLTMRGVTKTVTLDVDVLGVSRMRAGHSRGLHGDAKVNRKDYGILWNSTLDKGGTMLSDEVEITIDVEAKTPQPKPAPTAATPAAPAAPAAGGDKK